MDFGSASQSAKNHPGVSSGTVMSPKVMVGAADRIMLVEDYDARTDSRFLTEVV